MLDRGTLMTTLDVSARAQERFESWFGYSVGGERWSLSKSRVRGRGGGGMRAALLGLLRSFQDPAARYFDRTLKRP
jgi:hypothetical protein